MYRITLAALVAALLGAGAVATAARAVGDYGPDTCLEGFVWREASPTDHVCVLPVVRGRTSDDNIAAPSHRLADGITCTPGFVWRYAFPGDRACVDPAARAQAQADNAAADSRRDSIRISVTKYNAAPPCPPGDYCAQSVISGWRLHADHINVGKALVKLYPVTDGVITGKAVKAWMVSVAPAGGEIPGGRLDLRSRYRVCKGKPDAAFYIRDPTSGRWSVGRQVPTLCKPPAW